MAEPATRKTSKERVRRHRRKALAEGSKRVEVTVPAEDAELIRAVARTLREGGKAGTVLRRRLADLASAPRIRTAADLFAALRSTFPAGMELEFERDRSPGRPVDLE